MPLARSSLCTHTWPVRNPGQWHTVHRCKLTRKQHETVSTHECGCGAKDRGK